MTTRPRRRRLLRRFLLKIYDSKYTISLLVHHVVVDVLLLLHVRRHESAIHTYCLT